MNPNISLRWDGKKKSVVSKSEQIGLARRQLIPFVEPSPFSHSTLADVLSVPNSIFDLENLSDVLTYEVWQNNLSPKERRLLSRFLPKGLSPDAIVQALLAGDNFHFGNPFTKWSASLCLGQLHPDAVIRREELRKDLKKLYYADLPDYHHNMIRNLQLWKEKWAICKNPEVEFVQNLWCSSDSGDIRVPPSESGLCAAEENLAATPDSGSWDNPNLAYSSDNQKFGIMLEDSQKRKELNRNYADSSNGLKLYSVLKKGPEKNFEVEDGTKYMSYVKVSKAQHARFKNSLKHSGNDFQPSSLNSVLGVNEPLDVQPFERFEEEENKKLHEYWLKMVTRDIPEGFLCMRNRLSEKHELACCIAKEMEQTLLIGASGDDKKGFSLNKSIKFLADGEGLQSLSSGTDKGEKAIGSESMVEEHDSQKAVEDFPDRVSIHNHDPDRFASFSDSCRMVAPASSALQDQHNPQCGSLSSCHQADPMERDGPLVATTYPRDLNHANIPAVREYPFSSAPNGCAVDEVRDYFDPASVNPGYSSHQELSLGSQQHMHGQTLQMLGLGADQQAKNTVLLMRSDNLPFFSNHTNPDRNELLQSVFRDQINLQGHHRQKQGGSDYPVIERGIPHCQMSCEMVHPSLALEMRQKRLDDVYLRENIYPGGCFTIPSQDNQLPLSQNWPTISPMCMVPSSGAHSIGGLGQGLHAYESGIRHGWPSYDVAGDHGLSNGINTDQTLYSVVSECSEISPRANHESMVSTSRVVSSGNLSGIVGGAPSIGLCPSQPLNYSADRETSASSIKLSNLGWMAIPPQDSIIQEPFLRPWNK